jgi:heterodisulfide reductase subunit A-like polyferredoxin
MKKRGPNLEKAYRRLPGIEIIVDTERCTGCGLCVENCFVADLKIRDGHAVVGAQCKGCGRCVEICPEQAMSLSLANEKELIRQIMERINAVADITSKG